MEGTCACGAVRYALRTRPMFVNCCHCLDCQRQTGSAFVINALIETDRIDLAGVEPEAVTVPTDSGRPHDIHRCPTCKVAVWSDYGRRPKLRFVRVGTLDDASALAPEVPWLILPVGAPAFDVFYDLEKQWSPESLARRKAILG